MEMVICSNLYAEDNWTCGWPRGGNELVAPYHPAQKYVFVVRNLYDFPIQLKV